MRSIDLSTEQMNAFIDAMRIIRNISIISESAIPENAVSISESVADLLDNIVIPKLELVEEAIDATP